MHLAFFESLRRDAETICGSCCLRPVQVTEARRLWAEEEGDIIDDCTVIVVLLDTPALSRQPTTALRAANGTEFRRCKSSSLPQRQSRVSDRCPPRHYLRQDYARSSCRSSWGSFQLEPQRSAPLP